MKTAGSKLKMSLVIDTMNLRQAANPTGEFLTAFEDEGLKSGLAMWAVAEVLKNKTCKALRKSRKMRTIDGQ